MRSTVCLYLLATIVSSGLVSTEKSEDYVVPGPFGKCSVACVYSNNGLEVKTDDLRVWFWHITRVRA